MNTNFLRVVKNATFAIGLRDADNPKNRLPISIFGTGFLIDNDGYLLTAKHVIDSTYSEWSKNEKEGKNVYPSIFSYVQHEDTTFSFVANSIIDAKGIRVREEEHDLDIAICRLKNPEPYDKLIVDKKVYSNVLDDIWICGYPLGKVSLDFNFKMSQTKTSPLLLPGKISSFTPGDNSPVKIDLITNIIGVSGLSGSPIIDVKRETVIGISQYVLSSPVFLYTDQGKPSGFASSGYLCGKTCDMMTSIPSNIEDMKTDKEPTSVEINFPKIE